MKLQALLLVALLALAPARALAASASSLYLPLLGKNVTGTDLGSGHIGLDVAGSFSFTEGATAANGGAPPAVDKVAGGLGLDGFIHTLKTDNSGNLQTGRTWTLLNTTDSVNAVESGTWNLNNISGTISLPTGAATSAKQAALGIAGTPSSDVLTVQGAASMTALKVDGSAVTQPVSGTVTANQGTPNTQANAWYTKISNGTLSADVSAANALKVDGSSQSGQPTPSFPLVVAGGDGTSATRIMKTTAGGNPLVELTDGTNTMPTMDAASRAGFHKITDGTNTAAVKASGAQALTTDPALVVSVSPNSPLPTGNNTIGKVVAFDTAPVNVNASNANSTVTTTPATLSAPANAVGFQLQNLQTSTANIRWQLGGASSSSSGAQLAPGQDSGFIPAGSNVSIAAESGTQNYSIQWVSQ